MMHRCYRPHVSATPSAAPVTLAAMPPERFATWQADLWERYRADLLANGESESEADANIARNRAAMMPDGRPGPDQHVLEVISEGRAVGAMWLAAQSQGEWFVYEISIDPELRGRGLGRSAMVAAEAFVRERGGTRIGLSVFGSNVVAQGLYRSLGYSVIASAMRKTLD